VFAQEGPNMPEETSGRQRIKLSRRERKHQGEGGEIAWGDYPRVQPGEYVAYCAYASKYFDRPYKRWVCFLRFNLLAGDLSVTVAAGIPMWLSLGSGEKPRAPRRGRFFQVRIGANRGPPARGDRLSTRVFPRRVARVLVGDTTSGVAPYSVVKEILSWETGL
jgi:hypothetical protein